MVGGAGEGFLDQLLVLGHLAIAVLESPRKEGRARPSSCVLVLADDRWPQQLPDANLQAPHRRRYPADLETSTIVDVSPYRERQPSAPRMMSGLCL